jgi:hypothetical protein
MSGEITPNYITLVIVITTWSRRGLTNNYFKYYYV